MTWANRVIASVAVAIILLGVGACAEQPPAGDAEALAEYKERNDPYEPLNRKLYAVNDFLDRNLARPLAVGYRDAVPETVRTHLHNTLSNLNNPVQFANDVMQGKPRKAGNTLMRAVINSTIGIGGVFDVAAGWGYPDHDTDFGLTLALWGVPGGPFLFLPVLGPSDPRDAVGYGANTVFDPLTWVGFPGSAAVGWTRGGLGAVDGRERALDDTDAIEKTALDPYATFRSLWQQHRQSAISAGRQDLPATVPAWYPQAGAAPSPAPPRAVEPAPEPTLAPPPAMAP